MNASFCPTCGHSIGDPSAQACPNCGAALHAASPPPPPPDVGGGGVGGGGVGGPPPPIAEGSSVPFDDTSRPFMERLLETVKMGFSDPVRMFSNLPEEDIGPPVLFGVVVGTVATVFAILWQIMFSGMTWFGSGEFEQFAASTTLMVFLMIFSPILVAVGLFISAGIYHLMLLICGDGSRGFGVTMRAVCYGYTPNLLAVVPFCGGIVGGIWALVLTIMGAMYGHRTEPWRAILAYFLPLILCCCLALGLMMMFGFFGSMAQ